jgi:hypothetical protein
MLHSRWPKQQTNKQTNKQANKQTDKSGESAEVRYITHIYHLLPWRRRVIVLCIKKLTSTERAVNANRL